MYVDDVGALFLEYQGTIKEVCKKHHNQFGGDLDELIGEANLKFLDIVDSFDEEEGTPFVAYLTICLKHRLRDLKGYRLRRRSVWAMSCEALVDEDTGTAFRDLIEDYRSPEFLDVLAFCSGFETRVKGVQCPLSRIRRKLISVLLEQKVSMETAGRILAAVQPML